MLQFKHKKLNEMLATVIMIYISVDTGLNKINTQMNSIKICINENFVIWTHVKLFVLLWIEIKKCSNSRHFA